MVKKFAIFLFCGFLTFSMQAQNFGGGIILGISSSQVNGDDLGGFNKAGLLAGVFANKSISELLSFQMEMTYIQKGSNNPNINNLEHSNEGVPNISSSYIEVPLIIQYKQSDILAIEGGVQIGYLIDAYYHDSNGGRITYTDNEGNYFGYPFINRDVGVLIGLKYKYSEHISINTRLSNSVFPIGKEDYENFKIYNSHRKGKYNTVLSFSIHYNFINYNF